jgi:endonuclease/exonuclease/phosphatase family metal-dependent hydrolase
VSAPHPSQTRLKPTVFEVQLVKFGSSLTVVNLYRSLSWSTFLDETSELLSLSVSEPTSPLFICGDFNCRGTNLSTIRGDYPLELPITSDNISADSVPAGDEGIVSDRRLITASINAGISLTRTESFKT